MRVTAVRTLTGEPIADVQVSAGSWKSSLTLAGEGSFTIQARDQLAPVDHLDDIVRGWATTIVVSRGTEIVYAGIVVGEEWDEATGACTVSTLEVDAILEHRMLFAVGGYQRGTKQLTGLNLSHVIWQVYWWALINGGPNWRLPIDMPTYVNGNVARDYYRYNFQSAKAFLDQLTGEEDAPDVFLRPSWVAGRLRWRLELGTPLLDAGTFSWEVATHSHRVKTPVVDVRVKRDWSGQRSGIFALGSGSEEDMLHATAGTNEVPGPMDIPWLDAPVPFKNVDDPDQLKALAVAELENRRLGVEQWSFGLELGDELAPDSVWPAVGSILQLRHPGSERVPAGTGWHYVLAVSGTVGGSRLSVETQPVGVT